MVNLCYAPVAQMDRVHASGAWGREFESHRARHFHSTKSTKSAMVKRRIKLSLRLMNEASKKVEAKYMALEKKGRRLAALFIFLRKSDACIGRGHLRIGWSTI